MPRSKTNLPWTPTNAAPAHHHWLAKNLIWIIIRISSILDFEWIGIRSQMIFLRSPPPPAISRHRDDPSDLPFVIVLKERISCHRYIVFTKCYVTQAGSISPHRPESFFLFAGFLDRKRSQTRKKMVKIYFPSCGVIIHKKEKWKNKSNKHT